MFYEYLTKFHYYWNYFQKFGLSPVVLKLGCWGTGLYKFNNYVGGVRRSPTQALSSLEDSSDKWSA